VIGIAGGIGSGKSAVARGLAERLRVFVVDADRIGHDVLTLPEIKQQIFQTFGADVFVSGEATSEIDRRQLAKRVFGNETHLKKSLIQLEAIVHPEIRRQMQRQIRQHQADNDVVLLDAAVMLEAGWNDLCEALVFVAVPFEVRLDRVVKNRGWDEEELRKREASQLSVDEKAEAADFVIDNSGSLENSVHQLNQIVLSLKSPPDEAAKPHPDILT
jgi:dephospho-CoA kinase